MKRTFTIIASALFLSFIPLTFILGQDKKNEEKIKIVIADGSGKKTVIDTVITDGHFKDSIRLKNGKVIFIGHQGDEAAFNSNGSNEHVFVSVSSDGKDSDKQTKTVTIISSDSTIIKGKDDGNEVYVINNPKKHEGKMTYSYSVISNDSKEEGNEHNSTKYVIAKDGMVVTVEGNDDEKAKQLVNEIKEKLGVKSDDNDKSTTVKVETKKKDKK